MEDKIVEIAEGVARIEAHMEHVATREDLHAALQEHLETSPHQSLDWSPIISGTGKILLAVATAIGLGAAFYFAL